MVVVDINTHRKMAPIAHREKRASGRWALVNPGNAVCLNQLFDTRKCAEEYKRTTHTQYVVVRVVVRPLYDVQEEFTEDVAEFYRDEPNERPTTPTEHRKETT